MDSLYNEVYKYLKANKDKDSIEVTTHFKLRASIRLTMNVLGKLKRDGKISRMWSRSKNKNCYIIKK